MDSVQPLVDKLRALGEGFFWILPDLAIAAVVFAAIAVAAHGASRGVRHVLLRRDRHDLGVLMGGFVRWALLVVGALVAATIVFPSIKPADLLATLGVGSIAIGFAFKDILQNWLSGLLILYNRPFIRGDQIVSGEFEGTVEHVEPRATLIRTYDGQRVVIPNADIYTRAVVVRTAFQNRRSEADVGIGYGDDIARACDVIVEALAAVPGVEADPPPEAFAWELAGSSVVIRARWWSRPERRELVAVRGRAVAAIKQALDRAAIDMPFPTQVMLFHDQTEEADGDRTRQREGWPAGDHPPPPNRPARPHARDGSGAKPVFIDREQPSA